jgi:hypothetical protein
MEVESVYVNSRQRAYTMGIVKAIYLLIRAFLGPALSSSDSLVYA